MEKKSPAFTIRPVFSPLLAACEAIPLGVTGAVGTTFAGGIFLTILLSMIGLGWLVGNEFFYLFIFVLSTVLLPFLYYDLKRKAHQRTFYSFYDDYFEYQHYLYFLNRHTARVWYKDINDITEHANFVQERENLITLYLFVPSMPLQKRGGRFQTSNAFSGVKLADVDSKADWGGKILALIDRSMTAKAQAVQATPLPPAGGGA
jgi:hypothetical protein